MDNHEILRFLTAIDDELIQHAKPGETLELYLLGRSALILGYGVALMTKDVDVVETHNSILQGKALAAFGRNQAGAERYGFYLETVSSGLPPLPGDYERRCIDLPGPWKVLRPKRPEIHDLVVTKLTRFHAKDRDDVRILCDTGEVAEESLRERFESAHLWSDRDDPKVIAASTNLESVVNYLQGRRKSL